MALKNLDEFLKKGHTLPIGAKEYHIPHVPAEPALEFARALGVAARIKAAEDAGEEYEPDEKDREVLSDNEERDLYREALGDTYDEMIEDGVPFSGVRMAATYVLMYAVNSPEAAERWWNAGGKAPSPNRKARRTATRTRTAAGGSTR